MNYSELSKEELILESEDLAHYLKVSKKLFEKSDPAVYLQLLGLVAIKRVAINKELAARRGVVLA